MWVGVRVLPRKEVLDTQGRAVSQSLSQNGFTLKTCHVGKYIELEIETQNKQEALDKAKEIAEFVLYNPLIEDYELEALDK